MLAFAANSILARQALMSGSIDADGFTAIRLVSGALMLLLLWRVKARGQAVSIASVMAAGSWYAALMLFAYAACFSWAYLSLSAGTGALILFGAVQVTMMAAALVAGERPGLRAWFGYLLALSGLIYLLAPGVTAPPMLASLLMMASGIAWGLYSLRGRGVSDPLAATAGNFVRTLPFAVLLILLVQPWKQWQLEGVLLAIASGALASGIGYAIWYHAVARLTTNAAATVQLSVPLLAAGAGVLLLGEPLTLRLMAASVLILGGIYLSLRKR